jgi:predicted SprT family Zn-dependent metalloprotease
MGDKVGGVEYMPEHTFAEINILRTKDRKEKDDSIEEDIIHELLHLLISGHKHKQEKYDELFERGLNCIAKALYEGYRDE